MSGDKQPFELLSSSNYHVWKFRMQLYLEEKGLWVAVKKDTRDGDAGKKLQSQAKGVIGRSVSDEFIEHVVNADGGAEAWDALAALFVKSSVERRM
jgi:hypothetical protein